MTSDMDKLAEDAVAALVKSMSNLANAAGDALVDLLTERFEGSRTGSRALGSLQARPDGKAERELATAVLADELHRDSAFAARVAAAMSQQHPRAPSAGVSLGARSVVRGDIAGGDIDKSKRYHIGSIRFGGGGLTALIIAGVVAAGGGGTVLYAALAPSSTDQTPATRSVFQAAGTGQSADLDASANDKQDGDGVVDVTFGKASLIATGGAEIARLPAGETAGRGACQDAVKAHAVPSLDGVKAGDVVCVRTTAGGIAAVTLSAVDSVGTQGYVKITMSDRRHVR